MDGGGKGLKSGNLCEHTYICGINNYDVLKSYANRWRK